MSSDVTVVDLTYLAPVPAGNEVLVLRLTRTEEGFFDTVPTKAECVIDQTTRIVYGDRDYFSVLESSKAGLSPTDSPAGALGPAWSVARSVAGKVVSAVLGTTDVMKGNYARTRLYMRKASAEGYR